MTEGDGGKCRAVIVCVCVYVCCSLVSKYLEIGVLCKIRNKAKAGCQDTHGLKLGCFLIFISVARAGGLVRRHLTLNLWRVQA